MAGCVASDSRQGKTNFALNLDRCNIWRYYLSERGTKRTSMANFEGSHQSGVDNECIGRCCGGSAVVERIENIEEELKELAEAKKEVYLEAKGNGFDVKIVREV